MKYPRLAWRSWPWSTAQMNTYQLVAISAVEHSSASIVRRLRSAARTSPHLRWIVNSNARNATDQTTRWASTVSGGTCASSLKYAGMNPPRQVRAERVRQPRPRPARVVRACGQRHGRGIGQRGPGTARRQCRIGAGCHRRTTCPPKTKADSRHGGRKTPGTGGHRARATRGHALNTRSRVPRRSPMIAACVFATTPACRIAKTQAAVAALVGGSPRCRDEAPDRARASAAHRGGAAGRAAHNVVPLKGERLHHASGALIAPAPGGRA
jgi:hypothetical protein